MSYEAETGRSFRRVPPDRIDAVRAEARPCAVVDVRSREAFEASRVPGATHASLDMSDFVARVTAAVQGDLGAPVIVYGWRGEGRSAARELALSHFTDVGWMGGGLPEWVEQGRPVERGAPKAAGR